MKKLISLLPALGLLASAVAAPQAFDFKDPKGVNHVTFTLDAPLETISGTASGVSGIVSVDPATLADFKGKIVVDAGSLVLPNPMMQGHMLGEQWIDAKKFPEITFEVKSVSKIEKKDDSATGEVTGIFTLHGVSKEITAPARVTYLPGKLKDRMPGMEGDLLVIRSEFTIKRGDFGIQPGKNEDKVASEVKVSLALAGAAKK